MSPLHNNMINMLGSVILTLPKYKNINVYLSPGLSLLWIKHQSWINNQQSTKSVYTNTFFLSPMFWFSPKHHQGSCNYIRLLGSHGACGSQHMNCLLCSSPVAKHLFCEITFRYLSVWVKSFLIQGYCENNRNCYNY